jgi:hypothetical protein
MNIQVNTATKEWQTKRDTLIKNWMQAAAALKAAKENEMELRQQVSEMLFPEKIKGTQRYELGGGYFVKLVHKLNYKLGNSELKDKEGNKVKVQQQVEAVMEAIEKCGNEGAFLVDRLIKTEYKLAEGEYTKLDDGSLIKKLINSILVTSDAAPSLELESPDKGK